MSSSRLRMLAVVIAASVSAAGVVHASVELQGLRTAVSPGATTIFLRVSAPVQYTPIWVDSRTYTLDMADASSTLGSKSQPVQSPLVSAYRVFTYEGADKKPHVRVEVALKSDAKVEAQQARGGVAIKVEAGKGERTSAGSQGAADGAPPSASEGQETPSGEPVPLNPKRGTAIRAVQVARLDGSPDLEVLISGDGALQYRTMRLGKPERLVLDIPDATNRIRQKELAVNAPPLRAVRIGQLSLRPLVSRVVMDLDSETPFEVRPGSRSLVVTLGGSNPQPLTHPSDVKSDDSRPELAADKLVGVSAVDPASAAEIALDKPIIPVNDQPDSGTYQTVIEPASTEPALVAHAEISESEVVQTTQEPQQALTTSGDAPAAPASQWREVPNPAALTPAVTPMVVSPDAAEELADAPIEPASPTQPPMPAVAAPVTVTAGPRDYAAPAAYKPEIATGVLTTVQQRVEIPIRTAQLIAQQQTPPPSPGPQTAAPVPTPARAFTGEPISVNLKDVDLKDFFRLIHEISGLNIVLDPNVTGTVTIVLDEVPWDQAMDIVMRNNQLGKEVEGTVVRIAKLATLEAEEKQRRDLAVAVEQAQPKTTVTRTLSYAKAADLIPTLRRFLTQRGDMVPDVRTNTIIITDIPGVIPTVDRLIQSLDQKSLQVEIEARVVSASRSFARDIGTQLAASGLTGNLVLGGTGAVGESPIRRGTAPPMFIGTPPTDPSQFANLPQPLSVNLPAQGPTSGLSFSLGSGGTFALDAIITAAESKGIGKLLSRPKIITQNNIEATVKQGVRIPIQTTVNNTISVQYVDVVLRLTVTPQITAEGTIFLKTDIENTSIDPGIATTPGQFGLDTQSATTQVLVSNGGTVFFGGVVQNINRLSEQQVPLLGSVPLVGNLFKRKQTTSTSNELLFFITPRIV